MRRFHFFALSLLTPFALFAGSNNAPNPDQEIARGEHGGDRGGGDRGMHGNAYDRGFNRQGDDFNRHGDDLYRDNPHYNHWGSQQYHNWERDRRYWNGNHYYYWNGSRYFYYGPDGGVIYYPDNFYPSSSDQVIDYDQNMQQQNQNNSFYDSNNTNYPNY